MIVATPITLQLPERLYQRFVNAARATQRSLEAVILHALEVGSPPDWDDVPEAFQADLAALEQLDDASIMGDRQRSPANNRNHSLRSVTRSQPRRSFD